MDIDRPERLVRAERGVGMRCHLCGLAMSVDDFLPDVHTDCFTDCHCFSCTDLRQQMAEDWHEQMAFEASRGN